MVSYFLALVFLPFARFIARRICIRLKMWGEPVGILGFPDRRIFEVANFFTRYPQKGLIPSVVFVNEKEKNGNHDRYRVESLQDVSTIKKDLKIDTVLVVVPNWNRMNEFFEKYRYLFERVILIKTNDPDDFSLTALTTLDFNGVVGFQVRHNLLNPWSMYLKRAIDLLVSTASIVFLFPFFALMSLLIHLDSPGGVFYRQERPGKNGKIFHVLKFRTMFKDSDQVFEAKLKEDPLLHEEWKKFQKLKNDPRVTRAGAFMRRTSVDELPQLWNVFKGEMSLVGPRPIMESQKDMYGRYFVEYSQVRPGMTGLWQVSGRNQTSFARRVEFDMEYIQRWSLWLDIYILFQTARALLRRNEAF